ncbi:hypothetical protein PUN28_013993 [Cardiocondyla obscurior]|uniref:Uncharacterized protein n=1 Tax=Cardiocondyla obscurior TaxID=286306 RepID=A0AAW2F782_9HYME
MSHMDNCFHDPGYNLRKVVDNPSNHVGGRNSSAMPNKIIYTDSKSKVSYSTCFWWNNDCEKLIRFRKAAFANLKFAYSKENLLNYKKIVAQTRCKFADYNR